MAGDETQKLPPVAGRYEIQKVIGSGGVSTVYQAIDKKLGRPVALKRMNRAPDQKERDLIEQAWRESMIVATLDHPNIVRLFDFGFDSTGAYIVMELINGENLEECLERGPLQMKDFYSFAEQALTGLIEAHDHALIHRDLKPGNFMIERTYDQNGFIVKILDFGLAKYAHVPRPQSADLHNTIMGSIYYMAPEQFSRQPVDHRTDLYALGCIFYEVLTGYNPFYGDSVAQIIQSHLHDRPNPLYPLRGEIAPELEAWVLRFLEKSPDARPQSAKEALKCLPPYQAVN